MGTGAHGVAAVVARERAVAAFEPQAPLPLDGEELGLPRNAKVVALRERRGPGRPPGSRNKRAEDVARAVIERLGDPLVMLASLAMTPADELVAAGLSLSEALAEKRLAALGVLPFLHQRKPLAVQLDGQVVHLTISTGTTQSVETVTLTDAEVVEIQDDSGAAHAPV